MTPVGLHRVITTQFRRHSYLVGFAVGLVGLGVWALLAPLPRRAVKKVILAGKAAIEARDIAALRPLLTPDFRGPYANSRDEVLQRLTEMFARVVSIEIRIKRIRTNVDADRAASHVWFYVSGVGRDGEFGQYPFRGLGGGSGLANSLEHCSLTLVKGDDGQWRVQRAELTADSGAQEP